MESKWMWITVSVTMIMLFGGMTLEKYSNNKSSIEKAKSGLEECPIKPGNFQTIWVKSCKEYSEISKDY